MSASLTMTSPHPSGQRLTYTLTVPGANLEAGSDSTVTVTVTVTVANSTDTTQSSRAYYRVIIADTNGKISMDTNPPDQTGIIGPARIAPGETYRHEVPFVVPSEGVYVVQLRDVHESHSSTRLAVAFESVAKVRSTDSSSDETIGPLALGQAAKVGPYEIELKVINSRRKSSARPPFMSGLAGVHFATSRVAPGTPAPTAQLAAGVVVRNPKGSREASLPIPTYETFTLVDGSGRSWEASGVAVTTTGWQRRPPPVSSGEGEFQHSVLRPGDYFYMSPIFYVPADAEGLMLIYRPLVKSPSQAVEFVIGPAAPAVPPSHAK